ncbi:MAG: hypothetical protein KDD64_12190, partial [Bdellovibrionales bacterium]|nr:hypothetical protein [Bdellovibrionales bacterium]
ASFPLESIREIKVEIGQFGSTKFDTILLREWSYLLRIGGEIHLPVPPSCDTSLHRMLENFFPRGGLSIVDVNEKQDLREYRLRKVVPSLDPEDSPSRYTFGIVTHGKSNEQVKFIIESIRAQKIPEYEIIICGYYKQPIGTDTRYLEFTEQDEKGWVTRKKNIICEASKFENIVVVHDRVAFRPGWYEGMLRYGNAFEALSCVQTYRRVFRTWDWVTFSVPYPSQRFFCLGLSYRDWDPCVFMDGGLNILKKKVWKNSPYNDELFWEEKEDVEFSHRLAANGVLIRFNPFAKCESLRWRHNVVRIARYNPQRLGKPRVLEPLTFFFNLVFKTKKNWNYFRDKRWSYYSSRIRHHLYRYSRMFANHRQYRRALIGYLTIFFLYRDLVTTAVCRIEIAKLLYLLGWKNLAKRGLKAWLARWAEHSPNTEMNTSAHFYLGEILLQEEDQQNAAQCFRAVLSIAPDHKRARERLRALSSVSSPSQKPTIAQQ